MARDKRSKPPIYYLLLSLTFILLAFGVVMIPSASSVVAYLGHNDSFFFLWRQLAYLALGGTLLFIFSKIDYRWLRKMAPLAMVGTIITLVMVLVPPFGREAGGASRWIEMAGFKFQPSELAKLTFVLYTADLLARTGKKPVKLKELLKPLGIPFIVVGALIMNQPDLGTFLVIAFSIFAMLFLAGTRLRELFATAAAGIGGILLLIFVEPYRFARLTAFLDPWADPKKKGFQIIQSLLAFGSGGLHGVGLGLSRQKFGYLPAPYTDFIFAVIGEELGLPGTLAVVFIFLALALVIMVAVRRCDDRFARLLGGGIGAMIISQAVINMGAVTGMLPITGIPLPLISFGGTSLVLTLASIGILLNLTTQTKNKKRGVKREDNDLRRRHSGPRLSRTGARGSA
ncbi:MAG: putative lipid II flippase FtsW [Actinomycetota bacterium]|nr:putative lipid II flippase FtsW [Actinomycetota bacterium]